MRERKRQAALPTNKQTDRQTRESVELKANARNKERDKKASEWLRVNV